MNDNYYKAVSMERDVVLKSNSKSPFTNDRGKTMQNFDA